MGILSSKKLIITGILLVSVQNSQCSGHDILQIVKSKENLVEGNSQAVDNEQGLPREIVYATIDACLETLDFENSPSFHESLNKVFDFFRNRGFCSYILEKLYAAHKNGATRLIVACEFAAYEPVYCWIQEYTQLKEEVNKAAANTTPLISSIYADAPACAKLLLRKGAKIDLAAEDGSTPLICAAEANNVGALGFLLERGAQVEIRNKAGNTALHVAVAQGNKEAVEVLLAASKKEVNVANNEGETPLHLAINNCDAECTILLLNHGADPNKRTSEGYLPLCLAMVELTHIIEYSTPEETDDSPESLHRIVMALMINSSINLNAQGVHGLTALHIAANHNLTDIMRKLLERGADPLIPNTCGVRAIDSENLKKTGMLESIFGTEELDDIVDKITAALSR